MSDSPCILARVNGDDIELSVAQLARLLWPDIARLVDTELTLQLQIARSEIKIDGQTIADLTWPAKLSPASPSRPRETPPSSDTSDS